MDGLKIIKELNAFYRKRDNTRKLCSLFRQVNKFSEVSDDAEQQELAKEMEDILQDIVAKYDIKKIKKNIGNLRYSIGQLIQIIEPTIIVKELDESYKNGCGIKKLYSLVDKVNEFSEGENGDVDKQEELAKQMSYKVCDIVAKYGFVKTIKEKIDDFESKIEGSTILGENFYSRFYPRQESRREAKLQ